MKKKFLVVAVGAALAAPMMASADGPTVYGKFHMSLDRADNGGAGAAAQETGYIANNTSRFGIKGSDDVGGGMKALYQVEIPFQADGESGSASATTGANTNIATRATYVGLSGGFGKLTVGKQDQFLKSYGRRVDLFNERAGDSRNVYAGGLSTEGSFQNNSINYSSPKIAGGLSVDVSYATDEASGTQNTLSTVGITWAKGPLMVGVAQGDRHNGSTVAGTEVNESVTRLVASFKTGAFGVYFMNDTQDNVGNAATTRDRSVMGIGATFKMGNSTFKLQNYTADKYDDATATARNGGSVLALGVDHALSKTTTAYFAYAKSDNDPGSTFSPAGAGHGDALTTAAGQSGTVMSVGMEILF